MFSPVFIACPCCNCSSIGLTRWLIGSLFVCSIEIRRLSRTRRRRGRICRWTGSTAVYSATVTATAEAGVVRGTVASGTVLLRSSGLPLGRVRFGGESEQCARQVFATVLFVLYESLGQLPETVLRPTDVPAATPVLVLAFVERGPVGAGGAAVQVRRAADSH